MLNGVNTYICGTTISESRLRIVAPTNTTWVKNIVTNAELEFNVASGSPAISGGSFSGTGNLIKSGAGTLQWGTGGYPQTIALTGTSSIIHIQGRTLKNDWSNSAWIGNMAGLTVDSGATFDIWDGNATVDELKGAGSIRKNTGGGTGTLTFVVTGGSATYSGTFSITAGTFNLVTEGAGTQPLSGSNTTTGTVVVSGGPQTRRLFHF